MSIRQEFRDINKVRVIIIYTSSIIVGSLYIDEVRRSKWCERKGSHKERKEKVTVRVIPKEKQMLWVNTVYLPFLPLVGSGPLFVSLLVVRDPLTRPNTRKWNIILFPPVVPRARSRSSRQETRKKKERSVRYGRSETGSLPVARWW